MENISQVCNRCTEEVRTNCHFSDISHSRVRSEGRWVNFENITSVRATYVRHQAYHDEQNTQISIKASHLLIFRNMHAGLINSENPLVACVNLSS